MTPAAHLHDTTPHRGPGRHALPLFIVCSVAVHALMLTTWAPSAPQVSSGGTTLTVALARPAPEPELKSGASAALEETPRRKDTAPAPRNRKLGSESKFVPPAVGAESSRRTPTGATAPSAELVSESNPPSVEAATNPGPVPMHATVIAARINLELARHFHYPAQAVRRGWQGTVMLGFRVGVNGAIENLHITQSSGYALLDRAALGALDKVHAIALDNGALRTALDLQLPVIYRLEES